ncbi:thioredoxin domain-containing protein [Cognatishimia activa]|uniref:Thiol-disulfide oxidoreductase D n=1 Tax=Cognatishimia activa TaxID=1715691 RepID=A0A0P1J1Q8_9RHOB|nr:thioredoxin domain-containing protein [Cognatishimia activa]MEE2944004.1 thioredoxin domain-containing protein [Pseudomonadota bacterium]CUI57145.1 Thiol-disulfide oxidoreductase D [Cognatishimia activa]CUK24412.1 Thiol-disulfide oxidoreductase D [Cognatishimia activa]
MKRLIPFLVVIAIAVAGGAYFLTQGSEPANAQTATESTEAASVDTSGIPDMVLGNADAPITVIEYASYTCPHCATFHENTYPQLKADYIDTGKVKFVFREIYFDRFGLWASMIARCGGQERFFGITDLLMKGQSNWARAGDPVAIADEIRKVGRLAGLQDEQLQACLQDEDNAKALVAWYEQNATADDISSTPSFVINGTKYGNMSYEDFKGVLDGLL